MAASHPPGRRSWPAAGRIAAAGLAVSCAPAAGAAAETASWRLPPSAILERPARPAAPELRGLASVPVPDVERRPPGSLGSPAGRVPLDPLLDRLWRAGVEFRAGSRRVSIFGIKATNRRQAWFLGFYVDGEARPRFHNGRKMLKYKAGFPPIPILNGSAKVELGGFTYNAHIRGQLRDRAGSRLVLEPLDGPGPGASFPVRDLAQAAYDAGTPVAVAGRRFRLLYTTEILEDEDGGWAGFGPRRIIVLMFQSGMSFSGLPVFEDEIPADHIAVRAVTAVGAEAGTRPVAMRVGLRLDGSRELEIYDPGAQPGR